MAIRTGALSMEENAIVETASEQEVSTQQRAIVISYVRGTIWSGVVLGID